MSIKRINFNESLTYYLKNFDEYNRKECYVNTFEKFYNCNYDEIDRSPKSFKYSIGLLINDYDDDKTCYLHSWIEKDNYVIDVTPFANVLIDNNTPLVGDEYDLFKEEVSKAKYLSFKTISNSTLNNELRKMFHESFGKLTHGKAMEQLVRKWINEVENDANFKKDIIEYNYNYIED